MRLHSFRVRLTLLSVSVSGLVLAVFALSAWALIRRIHLDQIDREMAERVGPIAFVTHPREHWPWIGGGLSPSYGGDSTQARLFLVKGGGGEIVERSPNWPSTLPTDRFPAPSPADPRLRYLPPPPPPPSGPRRGGPPPEDERKDGRPDRPAPSSAASDSERAGPPRDDRGKGGPPPWHFLPVTPPAFTTERTRGGAWRFCTMQNGEVTVVLGTSLAGLGAEMARVRNGFLAALPVALLLIALGSWLVSRRALRSVEDLADVAERVTASRLDQRIPAEGVETEFRRLITVFNGMLDRLERSFGQAVRFSADAAHELRTPLTILQGEIAQALQEAPTGSEQQRVYNDLLEEVQRLKAITQKLLLLSQADSGQLRPTLERVSLTGLVGEAVEDAQALASHLTVTADLSPNVAVMADRDLVQQALSNLSSNAAKYNRDGGSIEFRLATGDDTAELAITNTGPGIPPQDHDRLFERFYRADPSRGRRIDGVGLGLSLAREIARAHRGDLVLVESRDDRTTFRVTLPLADPTREGDQASAAEAGT